MPKIKNNKMKKVFFTIALIFIITISFSQNVGINNTDPQTTLDLNGALRNRATTIDVTSSSPTVTHNAGFVILTGTPAGTPTLTVTGGNEGTRLLVQNSTTKNCKFPAGNKDIPAGIVAEYLFTTSSWQWIASNTPDNSWDLTGNLGINAATNFIGNRDNQPLIFKTGNTERMRLTNTGLEMSTEIKPGGVAGTNGQVLQSNGDGTMTWVNTAYNNNTRFQVRFLDVTASTNAAAPLDFMWYNLNSTNVNINVPTNTLTINKTGLYHFDVDVSIRVNTVANPTNIPFLSLFFGVNGSNRNISIGSFVPYKLDDNSIWELKGSKSFDLHIDASSTITLPYIFSFITGTKSIICILNGHLISE